jgi:two-component system CheB/CheR fusion protein
MVLTEVLDNGPASPDFTAIFDPFVTTKAKGMGMGLAICRSIIKAHDGHLWGSARPEGGTVFSFTLPCADETRHDS